MRLNEVCNAVERDAGVYLRISGVMKGCMKSGISGWIDGEGETGMRRCVECECGKIDLCGIVATEGGTLEVGVVLAG